MGPRIGAEAPRPVINNMDAVVAAVRAERLRRALYAGDDRAPEFGNAHRNFFGGQDHG